MSQVSKFLVNISGYRKKLQNLRQMILGIAALKLHAETHRSILDFQFFFKENINVSKTNALYPLFKIATKMIGVIQYQYIHAFISSCKIH